jgi:formylmethanofuran dehydrogenase subunit A
MSAVCVTPSPVPLTLKAKVPVLAVDVVVNVKLLLNGGVPESWLNTTFTPTGASSTQEPLSETLLAGSETRSIDIVEVFSELRARVMLSGDADSEKSNPGSLFIVRAMSFV